MPPLAPALVSQHALYGFNSFAEADAGCKRWSVRNSSALYRVDGWGAPYFYVNSQGSINVRPHGPGTDFSEEVDLLEVVERAVNGGMSLPLIVRFPELLNHRLTSLHAAFERGILRQGYHGQFQGVFPVKCNPDRYVVEDVVKFGRELRFGLEAGSKPELLMALSCMCHGHPEALLICNGYKDYEYVQLALTARQLGVRSVIVLEQVEELDIVLNLSQRMGVTPVIGVRAKLYTKHGGHWGETSGDDGKFGLSASEMVAVVSKLRRAGMLDCLQLLHFHIGSQIPSLSIVREGVSEAAHIFCELALMGAKMKYIDIGGGLGVDYDGSNSSCSDMSIGYTIEEYADQVVEAVKEGCLLKNVEQPILCCESGRGLVSYNSVLVFDVLSARSKGSCKSQDLGVPLEIEGLSKELAAVYEELACFARAGNYEGALDSAKHLKVECTRLFKLGRFSLELRAAIEELYEVVASLVEEKAHQHGLVEKIGPVHIDTNDCARKGKSDHSAIYHINLSIFKSMPDTWAIRQLFPIIPLHRLDEEPNTRAILSDLTCDSDGKVATFIGNSEPSNFLYLHELQPNKPYYMGMFLGGAYQEILGSMHNLFGTPNVVHVRSCGGPDGFQITRLLPGQTIGGVLRVVLHEPHGMYDILKSRVEDSLVEGRLRSENEALGVLHLLANTFSSSTYLSTDFLRGCSLSLSKTKMHCPFECPLEQAYCCT